MSLRIVVLTLRGEKIELDVDGHTSIGEVKSQVDVKLQGGASPIAAQQQRLLYNGTELNDDSRSLESYGVRKGGIIHVVARPPGAEDRARDVGTYGSPPPVQTTAGSPTNQPQPQYYGQPQPQAYQPQGFATIAAPPLQYPPARVELYIDGQDRVIALLMSMWRCWCVFLAIAFIFNMLALGAVENGLVEITRRGNTTGTEAHQWPRVLDFGYSRVTQVFNTGVSGPETVKNKDIDPAIGRAGGLIGSFIWIGWFVLGGAICIVTRLARGRTLNPAKMQSYALLAISVVFMTQLLGMNVFLSTVEKYSEKHEFDSTTGGGWDFLFLNNLIYVGISVTVCIQCCRGDQCRAPDVMLPIGQDPNRPVNNFGLQQQQQPPQQMPPPQQHQQQQGFNNPNAAQYV